MKLDLSKEEVKQLIFWCQANILTITNLIQTEDSLDTESDIAEYKQALRTAQSIYQKLNPGAGKVVSLT